MVTWQKIDAATFCDLVTEFLSLHPSFEPSDEKDFKNDDENKNYGSSMAKHRRISADANCILGKMSPSNEILSISVADYFIDLFQN